MLIALAAMKTCQFYAVVNLMRNLLNSIPWQKILQALQDARVSVYLVRIIPSYLRYRELKAKLCTGTVRRPVTCSIPQGSILGALSLECCIQWGSQGATTFKGTAHIIRRQHPGGWLR